MSAVHAQDTKFGNRPHRVHGRKASHSHLESVFDTLHVYRRDRYSPLLDYPYNGHKASHNFLLAQIPRLANKSSEDSAME